MAMHVPYMYGDQRRTRGNQFSLTMWVPGITLRLSHLEASSFTCCAILPVLESPFLNTVLLVCCLEHFAAHLHLLALLIVAA